MRSLCVCGGVSLCVFRGDGLRERRGGCVQLSCYICLCPALRIVDIEKIESPTLFSVDAYQFTRNTKAIFHSFTVIITHAITK
jgi:hypothetical protein